jgi:hypothetical protein
MTSDQAPQSRRNPLIIVAAAILGAGIVAFILLRPKAPEPADPGQPATVAATPLQAPKLTGAALHPTEPAAAAGSDAQSDAVKVCQTCEEKSRGAKYCHKDMGCEGLAGDDKTLCENLLTCLRAHPECRTTNPNLCYCGSAQGIDCVTAPKGECLEEALAAAKTANPTEGGIRFFRPDFPSGRASQLVVCDIKVCNDQCAGLP